MSDFAASIFNELNTSAILGSFIALGATFIAVSLGGLTGRVKLPIVGEQAIPTSPKSRIIFGSLGLILIALVPVILYVLSTERRIFVSKKLYSGSEKLAAKEIATDGEDIYVLRNNGNIVQVGSGLFELIDDGTSTKHIFSSGGLLWILKDNSELWYFSEIIKEHNVIREFSQEDRPRIGSTKKVVASGEAVYVLKSSGSLFKRTLLFPGTDTSQSMVIHRDDKPTGFNLHSKQWRWIYEPQSDLDKIVDIASSGSVLIFLTKGGKISAYVPNKKDSITSIAVEKGARAISVDGNSVYFLNSDRHIWKISDRPLEFFDKHNVLEMSANNGSVYALTDGGEVFRYYGATEKWGQVVEAGASNTSIFSVGEILYTIRTIQKKNGKTGTEVYRYSPITLQRESQ